MNLFCLFKRTGRPPLQRERVRLNSTLDKELHEKLLALVGLGYSQTDLIQAAMCVGLAVLESSPELIPTLTDKFTQTSKKAETE